MKKSSTLAIVLLAATFATAVSAADLPAEKAAEPATPKVTGDVYVGPVSKYLFRGNDLSKKPYGSDFAIQGGIDLVYTNFTLSYWGNALNRYSDNSYKRSKVNETDLILDYAIPHTIPYLDKLKLNVGTQYFAADGSDDTNEFYLKTSYDTLLKPTLAVYWDNMAATRAGLFYTASVSHKIDIKQDLLSANLVALASYNQRNPNAAFTDTSEGDGVYNGWHNYEITASIDYTPAANITITPSFTFSDHLSKKAKDLVGINAQTAYGIKAMFAF